jgi:hypothetical protein
MLDIFQDFFSDDIVNSSIKKDKLHQIIHNYQHQNDLKKQLLVIKNYAILVKMLTNSGDCFFN